MDIFGGMELDCSNVLDLRVLLHREQKSGLYSEE